ncbi:MAG: hypothetical protein ACRDN8_18780 [Thermoleophilaceae bacterium]
MADYTVLDLKSDVEDMGDRFVYLVLSGSPRVKLDDEIVDLKPMDAVRIPVSTARGFEAGPEGAEILAFGAPDTDNKDIEMDQGFWPA